MLCCRVSSSTLLLCLSVALLALRQPPLAQAQLQLSNINISRAVEILEQRFRQVASEGLGVDELKENYRGASYSYSDLNATYIEQLLMSVSSNFARSVDVVLSLFDDISFGSVPSTPFNPPDCCSLSHPISARSCCYSCEQSPSSTLSDASGAFARSSLVDNSTLLFASPDGSLLTQPATSAGCGEVGRDGRLQPWFADATRENPVEMVVVLDVLRDSSLLLIRNDSLYGELTNSVTTVLGSLNNEDRVALVGVGDDPVIPRASIFSQSETIPVCPEAILEMEAFMTSFTSSNIDNPDYNAAFERAFDLFSDDNTTDKLLLFFTTGRAGRIFGSNSDGENGLPATITRLSDATNDNVSVSVFRLFDEPASTQKFNSIITPDGVLSTFSDGQTLSAPLSSLVADYYPLNSRSLTPSNDVVYSHDISVANFSGGSLSITRPYFNGSSLLGVFRALLPWNRLLGRIFSALMERPSSYSFVTDSEGRVLYHPLIPSDGDDSVLITDLETELNPTELTNLLERLGTSDFQVLEVTKKLFRHTGTRDENAFFPHVSSSKYNCHRISLSNDDFLNLCIVLADLDMTISNLSPTAADPSAIFGGGFPPPVYHNLDLSAGNVGTCNYFCKESLNDRLSFQLTGLNVPGNSETGPFVTNLTSFITGGRATPPEGVEPLVATEIALASRSMATRWTNKSSAPSQYISRRHFTTSSGVYLSYPAIQMERNFIPSQTDWYQASVARGDLLTLTPPRRDGLSEAGEFAVSAAYTIRAPSSPSQQGSPSGTTRPLAVVAGDLTLSSVRSFLREAVPGCEEDSATSCLIIDDMLHLIYDWDTFRGSVLAAGNSPRFLGRPVGDGRDNLQTRYRGVLFDLVRGTSNLLTKNQCVDYYSTDIETRRFYQLDTSIERVVRNLNPGNCVNYMLQHIRGTNAFLLIVRQRSDCGGQILCPCSLENECQNCDDFNIELCECSCVCSDDCRRNSGSPVAACPDINTVVDNLPIPPSSRIPDSGNQLLDPPFCFKQECDCKGLDSCLASRDCSWCETERKCVHVTDCCARDESGACCGQSPQQERFSSYGVCRNMFTNICRQEPGAFSVTCPTVSSSQTSLIVAVVVGVTVGVVLVVFLVVFVIWYQFFRRADVSEETSRESAFDFSKKRMETTNPMANNTPDIKSDDGNDVGNTAKSMSPTSPHPPNGEPEKTDLTEKSNGKDETNL